MPLVGLALPGDCRAGRCRRRGLTQQRIDCEPEASCRHVVRGSHSPTDSGARGMIVIGVDPHSEYIPRPWLVARNERVDDVPSTAIARVRQLSRGGRRKNDVIDAAAAACVAALHGDANPVEAEDLVTVLALLDERRGNVITQRTRLVNQLHALLRDLVPGGAPTDLTVASASRLLVGVSTVGPVETARKRLARDLVADIRVADQR